MPYLVALRLSTCKTADNVAGQNDSSANGLEPRCQPKPLCNSFVAPRWSVDIRCGNVSRLEYIYLYICIYFCIEQVACGRLSLINIAIVIATRVCSADKALPPRHSPSWSVRWIYLYVYPRHSKPASMPQIIAKHDFLLWPAKVWLEFVFAFQLRLVISDLNACNFNYN